VDPLLDMRENVFYNGISEFWRGNRPLNGNLFQRNPKKHILGVGAFRALMYIRHETRQASVGCNRIVHADETNCNFTIMEGKTPEAIECRYV
jgi:hypothetical protein